VRAGSEFAYPESAIDKGIDYDAYTVTRDGARLSG
jgi:hypothetical protein